MSLLSGILIGTKAFHVEFYFQLKQPFHIQKTKTIIFFLYLHYYLKVGCLHPVACTRSGSGFPLEDGHTTETCSGY
jgi:hypothetical protein